MVHRCEKSPGKNALVEKLKKHFDDRCLNDTITFRQWTSTDSTRIDMNTLDIDDFIDLTAAKIDSFTAHSYIAKRQAKYLKERKDQLNNTECLVLLHFAETFSLLFWMKFKVFTGARLIALFIL